VDRFAAPPEYPPRSALVRDCTGCGACCAAPDCRCRIYAARPPVCRDYQPDWICGEVAFLPTLETRVTRFLEIYGLEGECF
jgi:hypothetical protein